MKFLKLYVVLLIGSQSILTCFAQEGLEELNSMVKPRMRVIIDNDLGGDPDGLFQLAHHLLSPSVEIRGIIASHLYEQGFGAPGTSEVLSMLNRQWILRGCNPLLKKRCVQIQICHYMWFAAVV